MNNLVEQSNTLHGKVWIPLLYVPEIQRTLDNYSLKYPQNPSPVLVKYKIIK